jgi:hypothetical protein
MSLLSSLPTFAAEPASILYIITGAAGFAYAGLRKVARRPPVESSTPMLFCRRSSHEQLKSLDLL